MKTPVLILIVVAIHCAAIGALFFIQGCGTTTSSSTPPAPVMPPPKTEVAPPPKPLTPEPSIGPKSVEVEKKELKTADTTEYTIKSGDSISAIAKRYHVSVGEIVELNKLADVNKVRVGQKLLLPGRVNIGAPAEPTHPAKPHAAKATVKAEHKGTIKSEQPSTEPGPAGSKEYVVKAGDSLAKIASQFGVKVSAIREANKLQGDKLKAGQKLAIPEPKKEIKSAEPQAAESKPLETKEPAATEMKPAESMTPAPTDATAPKPEAVSTPPSDSPTVGQGDTTAKISESAQPQVSATVTDTGVIHTVKANEDLASIAKMYAVTVDELAEVNQLGANRTVQVGQRLKIP